MNPRVKNILIGFIFLTFGALIGNYGQYYYHQSLALALTAYSVREGGYDFINPLLSCNISENKQSDRYRPINDEFKAYVKTHIANNDAQSISIYFRSLDGSRWSGVNENVSYSPASLLKLPLMIAYLKEADSNPGILQKQVLYRETTDTNQSETFKPKSFIKDGQYYSIADLLQYMIVDSDNNAASLLDANMDKSLVTDVYSDLGIPITQTLTEEDMSPKTYSYIFRILYNATYLSKSMSQYALKLMTNIDFDNGLRSNVPADVSIAHKFGERTVYTENLSTNELDLSSRELHDCGIIYYPKQPYLLCVMTKGQDFTKLSQVISDISKIAYTEVATKGLLGN